MMLWLYAPASCGLVSLTHIPQRMRTVLANIRHLTLSHSPQTHFIRNKKTQPKALKTSDLWKIMVLPFHPSLWPSLECEKTKHFEVYTSLMQQR